MSVRTGSRLLPSVSLSVLTSVRIAICIALAVIGVGGVGHSHVARASVAPASLVHDARTSPDTMRTTMDGVYTLAQATKGGDVFAAYCKSCHTPTVHSGAPFRAKWFGRSLSDLYSYLRREMPKNDPGSISDVDYVRALAYLLRINGMPAGSVPLAADSTALHRIRLDSIRAAPTAQGPRP